MRVAPCFVGVVGVSHAAELGTVVIGGLLSSTFLTLLVVPVVFSLVDGLKHRLPWARANRIGPGDRSEPVPG